MTPGDQMPNEPVVSLKLAQALKAAGAPQQGHYWWVKINQGYHLWEGTLPAMLTPDMVATYTTGEVIEALGPELSRLNRWDYSGGTSWCASGRLFGQVGYGDTPLEAVGRYWLLVLQDKAR